MKSTIQDCVGLQSNHRLRPPLYTGYFFFVPADKKSIHWLLFKTSQQRPPLYNGHFLLRGEGDPQGGHCREVQLYVVSSWYLHSSSWSVTPRATRAMMMTVPVFRAVTWTVTPRATNLQDIDKHSISSIFGPDLNSDSLVTGQVVLIMTSPGHMQYNETQVRKSHFNWVRETFFRKCQSQRTFSLIILSTIVILILMQKISFQ